MRRIGIAALALALATTPAISFAAPKLSKLSQGCVTCHETLTPGIIGQWKGSTHAQRAVGCYECHQADSSRPDAWEHGGGWVVIAVSPRDCSRCHKQENAEFQPSHHARAGNILASLDNFLAEAVEGAREPFEPWSFTPVPGGAVGRVNGMASVNLGCLACHGSKVALQAKEGAPVTADDLKPGPDGKPTVSAAEARIFRNAEGKPVLVAGSWPNTGIGRINLDGSLGACTACHSRHDFSARRSRQPENCGKCHLGPDHPQKEIYEESKHGVAYRDLKDKMNLGSPKWVLGKDYSAAPTCASCHMSANVNGGKVSHDIGLRISWTNRPPVSLPMDTDKDHKVVTETDPVKRKALVTDTAIQKRDRMKQACLVCHGPSWTDDFYAGYDQFVVLYNEKFAKPGAALMAELYKQGLLTKKQFDEKIEWEWFYLWHHEGRRARHGASMMGPDYAHWHGMYEVAEDFYVKVIPEALEIAHKAAARGKMTEANAVEALVEKILARPEHAWFLDARSAVKANQPVPPMPAPPAR